MSSILNLCDCSTNGLPLYQPARCMACGLYCMDCSAGISTNINLKAIEKRIQNQVRVHESQYRDVLGAVTIAGDYLNHPTVIRQRSTVWGNRFNLRNQSDRRQPSRNVVGNKVVAIDGTTNYVNVPTRGNSTRSTITANKPGAMTPGGYGVDVKHGSYARYLGKLKGRSLGLGDSMSNQPPAPLAPCTYTGVKKPVCTTAMNNKTYRFSLVSTQYCGDCPCCPADETGGSITLRRDDDDRYVIYYQIGSGTSGGGSVTSVVINFSSNITSYTGQGTTTSVPGNDITITGTTLEPGTCEELGRVTTDSDTVSLTGVTMSTNSGGGFSATFSATIC